MKKRRYVSPGLAAGAGALTLLAGCLGGSGSSDVATAYLVDSAVSGVGYTCGSEEGFTGANGKFKFQKGQDCVFSIGATQFTVGEARLAAGTSITPFDVFPEDAEQAVNLARLLQSLDGDGNPENGISISAQARAQVTERITFGAGFDTGAGGVMERVRAQVAGMSQSQLRTRVEALSHMARNVAAPSRYTVFERIAEIDAAAIATASGSSNATDQARYVAQKIAKYFYQNNDTGVYSDSDWVLAGAPASLTALDVENNINLINPYILELPGPNNSKTMVVEVCNKKHAGAAISGNTIPGGEIHGAALPCEIAIYTDPDTGKIHVDILDPVGSFAVFFNDLPSNPELNAMALQVKTEIKLVSYKGLSSGNIAHEKKASGMGPSYAAADIGGLSGQYFTYTYGIDTNHATWSGATSAPAKRAVAKKAAEELIKAMTMNVPYGYDSASYQTLLGGSAYGGLTFPPYATAGSTGINSNSAVNAGLVGDYAISANGYWRSARAAPLSVPRAVDTATYGFMYTVEACSPTYAKMALSMAGDSRDHATALPCQMSFYIDDSDPAAPKLKIVFLNPVFMFQTLFQDKLASLGAEEQAGLGAMAETVKTDLVNITRYVMDHNVPWVVPNPAIRPD